MKTRLLRLQKLVEEQRQAFNAATVRCTLDVLLERKGRYPGQLTGKTPYLQQVQVDGHADRIGTIVPVTITSTGSNSLFGSIVDPYLARGLQA